MGEPRIENITVSVRVRPLNPRELSSGGDTIWLSDSQSTIKEKAGARSFSFDRVYSESISTIEIFSYQGIPVLQKCLDGFNGCIFCYGQTGSGKTHTMHGVRKTNPGIAPLAIEEIFSMIQLSRGKEFLVRCSYIELYNESINDLLNPNLLNLQLAEDKKVRND
jgi:centromeric protein E